MRRINNEWTECIIKKEIIRYHPNKWAFSWMKINQTKEITYNIDENWIDSNFQHSNS